MKFILGEKREMSQIFLEDGSVVAVTAVKTYPSTVVYIRTEESDGYRSLQLGGIKSKEKNLSKSEIGHSKKYGAFRVLKEFRLKSNVKEIPKEGDILDTGQFVPGDNVTVSSTSKGKGFQGTVKRHNFGGGPRSHGQKHSEREPGSIGATGPQRVFKGTKMSGRMGGDRITIKNLKVIKVLTDEGFLYIKGAVPGRRGSIVEIKG